MGTCLFCLCDLEGVASVEHVIPASLGGWLTTDQVCKECNDFFGHEIEKYVDHSLMRSLRREAGLPVNGDDEGEFYDVQAGAYVPGRLDPEGRVEPISPVYNDGDRFLIRGESAEVEGIAQTKQDRATRSGRSFEVHPIEPLSRCFVRVRTGGSDDLSPFISLVKRDAAKMILEYIAIRAGASIAVGAELDPLRRQAVEGADIQAIRLLYTGPSPAVALPRTRKILHLEQVPEGTQAARRRQFEAELPAAVTEERPSFDDVPAWPSLSHHIGFWRDGEEALGFVTLFGSIQVQVPLAATLDIPWGSFESRDLTPGGT